jgi:hypothetical protein
MQIYSDAPLYVDQQGSPGCFLQDGRRFLGFPAEIILQFARKATEDNLHNGSTVWQECRPEEADIKFRISS